MSYTHISYESVRKDHTRKYWYLPDSYHVISDNGLQHNYTDYSATTQVLGWSLATSPQLLFRSKTLLIAEQLAIGFAISHVL